jgi:hypothetical protein
MLSVTFFIVMLNVVILNFVMMSVAATNMGTCHYGIRHNETKNYNTLGKYNPHNDTQRNGPQNSNLRFNNTQRTWQNHDCHCTESCSTKAGTTLQRSPAFLTYRNCCKRRSCKRPPPSKLTMKQRCCKNAKKLSFSFFMPTY